MGKAVVLAINAKYIHSSLSVWLLAESVLQYSILQHDVFVVEANINQSDEHITAQITVHQPDVVAVSAYIWNASKLPDIIKLVRKALPAVKFIFGGPEASHNAGYWIDCGADFVLKGEGEHSFPALLDALEQGLSLENISGLCRKNDGRIRCNPEIKPNSNFVDPFTEDCLNAIKGKIAYIETSRGCPFSCAFCLSGNDAVRFFPLDAVKEQIYKLSKTEVRIIKFVDRTFNCDAKRAYDLFEYIIGLDTNNRFHFEVAADLFDERTLALLADAPAGLMQFEAGLQSFFKPALEASRRKTDLTKAVRNIRRLVQSGNMHIHVDLIAGLPYETLYDFQNSFDQAYALNAHNLQLGFLKLLHGSEMRAVYQSIKCAKEPPYEIISSPWMSAEDLKTIKQAEDSLQNTYNKGRFLSAIQYVLNASKLRPFTLYQALGKAVPKNRLPLEIYAERIYDFCKDLEGVDCDMLADCMICDWLSATKGANMPQFLRTSGRKQIAKLREKAEAMLGRRIRFNEAAVLKSGRGVFVDTDGYDKVSGLCKLYFEDMSCISTNCRI